MKTVLFKIVEGSTFKSISTSQTVGYGNFLPSKPGTGGGLPTLGYYKIEMKILYIMFS